MSSITVCEPKLEQHPSYVNLCRRVFRNSLILSAILVLAFSLSTEPNKLESNPFIHNGASAHSNLALFILQECVSRAQREQIFREEVAKANKDREMTRLENYAFTAGGIVTAGALLTEGWGSLLGIPTAYYFISWEREIYAKYEQEMKAAVEYSEAEQDKCEDVAKLIDEELRYVDEAERNIHFEFASGSTQYHFLDISPAPNGSVTLEHIRSN